MTTNDQTSILEAIGEFANRLYRRSRNAGVDYAALASAIHDLSAALERLKVEREDPASPLFSTNSKEEGTSAYERQLKILAEDSDFTLRRARSILDRYDHALEAGHDVDPTEKARKIESTRNDVRSQALEIDNFLDTVRKKPTRIPVTAEDDDVEGLNAQVDEIASRLFRPRGHLSWETDEDELWQVIKTELESRGRSSDLLRDHKVLQIPTPFHVLSEYDLT